MKKKNLIGQKFHKLTVISTADNILPKNGSGRSFTAWNCQCECGTIIQVRTGTLISGLQKSCGCYISQSGTAIKYGQKFHKLTAISYDNGYWNCLCECGSKTTVLTHYLISGNTKSCGCLKSETSQNNIQKAIEVCRIYEPHIATARRRWKSYLYQDEKCDLTFEQWFQISQQNCFYCGIEPSNKINCFIKKKSAPQNAKNNGYFTYNGLDRIDNSLPHIIENVVSCCWICNRAKNERITEEFYQYIKNLQIDRVFIQPTKLLELPLSYLLVSVKGAYRHYPRNYGTIEIDLQTFYTYSQLPCFYCGMNNSNYFNVYLKDKKASQAAKDGAHFYYNGIDRLDNTKTHTVDNIVPCCYYCNFAKRDLSFSDFQVWIRRIQQFQKTIKS